MNPDHVILLVEDLQDDIFLITKAFDQAGLTNEIHVVENGEEAIAYLSGEGKYSDRARHPLPRLILLDLNMPRVDGFEVLRWLRQQPEFRGIMVVVLTLSSDIRDVNRAYQLGANSFMVKPTEFEDVTALITQLEAYWRSENKAPPLGGRIQPP
jgi:CheY-like chemotaxis protein